MEDLDLGKSKSVSETESQKGDDFAGKDDQNAESIENVQNIPEDNENVPDIGDNESVGDNENTEEKHADDAHTETQIEQVVNPIKSTERSETEVTETITDTNLETDLPKDAVVIESESQTTTMPTEKSYADGITDASTSEFEAISQVDCTSTTEISDVPNLEDTTTELSVTEDSVKEVEQPDKTEDSDSGDKIVVNETDPIEINTEKEPDKDDPANIEDLDLNGDSSKNVETVVVENTEKEDETKEIESMAVTNSIENIELNNFEEENRENPCFVGVDDKEDDKDSTSKDDIMEEDPIAGDGFIPENQEGADEELCIIPDTERVISQEEKDAASAIPPLRDISEASSVVEATDSASTNESTVIPILSKYVISSCTGEELQNCIECCLQRKANYSIVKSEVTEYVCSEACVTAFKKKNEDNYIENSKAEDRQSSILEKESLKHDRFCIVCKKKTDDEENSLTWEIMDFCNEFCLSKYQKEIGSVCAACNVEVRSNSLGKYCVRFGNDIKQFCTSHCLEEHKKGLKVCSYCQHDMSIESDGFLAPVGDKGQFKDFCSQKCMEQYDVMTNSRPPKVAEGTICSVCKICKQITTEYKHAGIMNYFCSDRCFVAFSFVNNISPGKCGMCRRYYPEEILEKNTMFYDNVYYSFCSNSCQNVYIIAHRKIVPCVWCKVKKYNFDMIRRYFKTGPVLNMCSINCLSLFQVSVNAVNSKKTMCNFCNKKHQPMYHLTMSDATIRNFCSYACVMSFQNKFKKLPITLGGANENYPVPAGEPKKNGKFITEQCTKPSSPTLPVISSVTSLASAQNGSTTTRQGRNKNNSNNQLVLNTAPVEPQIKIKHHIIIKPSTPVEQRNVSTMCKLRQNHKTTMTTVTTADVGVQTDQREAEKILIPVPVPIYIPAPMAMYSMPIPVPIPFPLPIPIPIFIPTTRNSAKGIMKEIKKIQIKIPTDPYEAELLMMAEMVAGDKKEETTDSESDVEDTAVPDEPSSFSPEPVDASNTFGEDMLQMALKMATELEEPAVDLEGALTANTITAPQGSETPSDEAVDDPQIASDRQSFKGRKRSNRTPKAAAAVPKRRRVSSQTTDIPPIIPQPVVPQEPVEKPDAHLCLKYTFGVNAWKQWVTTKNTELEKSSKYSKPFKTEILQLTADELNYSLCLFVKEVRKPNGAEYAPDTIYYLCLGIQQYLFENTRIDNIFCDPYYEQFTDSLDEVARKFSVLYNDSHYIVTRVEEEHLWESKQLGAHSPHVLLSTLMFFNTKHFNLTSVQEHMQLSFSHIMKHWKRNPSQPGVARVPGSRNVLLRFYPPQTAMQNSTRKKKVYEQQENDENPLRCPVKLYEFYLSKCPESVKTRNDVFYLQPERSCVPDSPVWYSTTALPQEALEKMLHRVKMVKEINVALLTI